MGKIVDLTGQRFGRLVVIKREGSDKFKHSTWLCKCDCGNIKIVDSSHLKKRKYQKLWLFGKRTIKYKNVKT